MSTATVTFDELDEATFSAALETWGWQAQVDLGVEESAELIRALSRYMNGRSDGDEDVVDEIADMAVMVEQLAGIFGRDRVAARAEAKMDRLRDRLADEGVEVDVE